VRAGETQHTAVGSAVGLVLGRYDHFRALTPFHGQRLLCRPGALQYGRGGEEECVRWFLSVLEDAADSAMEAVGSQGYNRYEYLLAER
jgi:hypothetical protein